MRRIIDKIILLVLLTSIGVCTVSANLVQNLELSTHTADGNNYMDAIATTTGDGKIKFIVDNVDTHLDWTIVSGTNKKTSRYYGPFTVGSTHTLCVINTVDEADKMCKSITIPSPTSELTVTNMDIKRSDTGYITVTIFYTGSGIIGVSYDNNAEQITASTPNHYIVKTLITPITIPGTYEICSYNANNYDAGQVCETLEISDPYTIDITKLYINNTGIPGEGWITVDVETTGSGTLGFDIDNVLIWTRVIAAEDGGIGTQFKTTPGDRTVCVYDYIKDYNPTNICKSINVLSAPVVEIDKEDPTILSVDLSPSTPFVGETVTITVNAIDNVKVTSVTADGKPMTFYSRTDIDSYWESTLVALKGTHIVSIEAKDSAGNTASDSDSYTATEKPTENLTLKTDTTSTKGLIPLVTDTPKKVLFGKLFVDSAPNNSNIYINGVLSGTTPKSFVYPVGGLEVKIKRTGYKEYVKNVIITETNIVEVAVKLIPLNSTTNYTVDTAKTENSTENNNIIEESYNTLSLSNENVNVSKNTNEEDKSAGTIIFVILTITIVGLLVKKYFDSFKSRNSDSKK